MVASVLRGPLQAMPMLAPMVTSVTDSSKGLPKAASSFSASTAASARLAPASTTNSSPP
ncbi:Uncharacterised protein [Nocardia africana]|uniref:Uncharacterized protein n=1 Tax=Nocardia africana TaxID=134964 RepID=A0A378WPB1_9NOCA|nr:Uncharacterised protein [Nocardia africana]